MQVFRQKIHPGLRGAVFYASYWGVFGLVEPFMNVYFMQLGLTNTQIGLLSSLSPLAILTVAPFIASFADRHRKRTITLAIAILGVSIALLLLQFPKDFKSLLPFMALYALCLSPNNSISDGLLARMANNYRLDYGKMRLWGSISFAITAIGMGAVYQQIGYGSIFLIGGVLILPVTIVSLLLEEPEKDTSPPEFIKTLGKVDWGLVFMVAATFLIGAAQFLSFIFRGIYMDSLGGGEFLIGLAVGVSALTEFPTMHYASKIMRKLNGTTTLLASYALLSAGIMGFAFTDDPWVLVIMSGIKGLGFGLFAVATVVIIDRHAPADKVATYQSITYAMAWGLAPLITGVFGGSVYDLYGGKTVFLVAGILPVLAGIVLTPTYYFWSPSRRLKSGNSISNK
jgi:MFS transporter, PPP family, 3-phenylpropionic acid transporter